MHIHHSTTDQRRKTAAVFVYGTLRRGGVNHRLLEAANFCGETSIPGFVMWSFGAYPAVVPAESAGAAPSIKAELYEVDAGLLARLDRLEDYYGPGHPRNLYDRREATDAAGRRAFLYVLEPHRLEQKPFSKRKQLLPGGDWMART